MVLSRCKFSKLVPLKRIIKQSQCSCWSLNCDKLFSSLGTIMEWMQKLGNKMSALFVAMLVGENEAQFKANMGAGCLLGVKTHLRPRRSLDRVHGQKVSLVGHSRRRREQPRGVSWLPTKKYHEPSQAIGSGTSCPLERRQRAGSKTLGGLLSASQRSLNILLYGPRESSGGVKKNLPST